jgi:hypothetical protein
MNGLRLERRRTARNSLLLLLPWAVLGASIGDGHGQSGGSFELRRSTIDGGGGRSTGGAFEATGTIGQPDAGASAGGAFELRGGFWAGPAPVDASDGLFSDGFEPTAGNP